MHKLEWLKTRADAALAFADKVFAAANANQTKAADLKQKAAAKATELATQLDTAKADAKSKLDAAAATQNAAKAAEAKRVGTANAARDAKLALEPVSIFIGRATQRLYVRHGFEVGFDVPVTIRNPDQPLGTHIFTAVARTDDGLRWTAITIGQARTTPRARSTASASRRTCLIASRRPHCRDPRSSSRTTAEPRD